MTSTPKARPRAIFWTIVLALLLLTPSLWLFGEERGAVSGRWLLDFEQDGSIHLTLKRRSDGRGHWNSWNNSSDYELSDFRGLQRPSGTSDAPSRFEMVRDAGTIAFEGRLDEAGGGGKFTHTPSPEYVAALRKMGYEPPSDSEDLFSLTVHDVSRAFIADLQVLGYKRVPLDDLVGMRIHGASSEFIRELKSLGYSGLSTDELVSMRIHGTTPAYIRQMKSLGYDALSADDLVSMRIHGATPEFVEDLRKLGYRDLSAEDLVSMRIHGVTPEYIQDLQELGYRDVSADDLVSMRIHGVTIDYVRKMKARLKTVSVDELVSMRIHGRG